MKQQAFELKTWGGNAMMGRSGPVFADRYHAHALRAPAEVRNAIRYVLGNFASHAARRGEPTVRSRVVRGSVSLSFDTPPPSSARRRPA